MHKATKSTILVVLAAVLAHVGSANGGPDEAFAKPPTPTPIPLDGGWIYYGADRIAGGVYADDSTIVRTSPDGAVNEEVVGAPARYGRSPGFSGSWGVPSHVTHDGDRWYLAYQQPSSDIVFPNIAGGHPAREIDVIREGDTQGLTVTTNRASCIFAWSLPVWARSASGTPDAAISWSGAQWADQDGDPAGDCEVLVSAGIFRADVVYDTNGAITSISAPVIVVPVPVSADNTPNAWGISWSPNSASATYPRSNDGLYVATAGGSMASQARIVAGHYTDVNWSPDQDASAAGLQTTIAFIGWSSGGSPKVGVWGVQPTGAGLKLLAEAKQGKNGSQSYTHESPFWSPAGSHLGYRETGYGGPLGWPGVRTVRRMAKDGTGNVVLATDSPTLTVASIMGWTSAN